MQNHLKNIFLESVKFKKEIHPYYKVLYWFFSYPLKEMSLNELSRELKISKTTANKIVNNLVKENFLKKKILGKQWLISCNLEHKYNTTIKIPYNLSMIYESNIIETIHDLISYSRSIILFGSYRKGNDTEKSDIDIAVEILEDKDIKIYSLGVIKQFGFRKNVNVNVLVFSRKKIDINLFSNIANGIILEGFLEVKL